MLELQRKRSRRDFPCINKKNKDCGKIVINKIPSVQLGILLYTKLGNDGPNKLRAYPLSDRKI